jgi:hypothetical protein
MPKTPIDYAKTIIYKLVHKDDLNDENIYTGHTTDFICRKNRHKHSCNTPTNDQYNTKKYKYIRENGGWDEWLMIEIEKYPCKDKYEARARERVIQAEMKAKLNDNIPGRTNKEWKIDNHDKILEQGKQYHQSNRDKIAEHHKKYYQNNRDKLLEYHKQYRQQNPEKILEKTKERIICDVCGKDIAKYKKSRHQKTNSCINFKLNKI